MDGCKNGKKMLSPKFRLFHMLVSEKGKMLIMCTLNYIISNVES
jgi:hypothetical protein